MKLPALLLFNRAKARAILAGWTTDILSGRMDNAEI
jgi:hypothetical protein